MGIYKNFMHISTTEINKVSHKKQKITWKPSGIYAAKGNSWLNFMKNHLNKKTDKIYKYSIVLSKDADIVTLDTIKSVEKFLRKYGKQSDEYYLIDWRKVSKDYDGIHVTKNVIKSYPKKEEWIIKYLFITMFDVETLCIWNNKKISLVEKNA
jgi:hypothetical protein